MDRDEGDRITVPRWLFMSLLTALGVIYCGATAWYVAHNESAHEALWKQYADLDNRIDKLEGENR